jgi:hypothetical protein
MQTEDKENKFMLLFGKSQRYSKKVLTGERWPYKPAIECLTIANVNDALSIVGFASEVKDKKGYFMDKKILITVTWIMPTNLADELLAFLLREDLSAILHLYNHSFPEISERYGIELDSTLFIESSSTGYSIKTR